MHRGQLHLRTAALFALLLALLLPGAPASAGEPGPATASEGGLALTAEAGYAGRYLAGRRLPVRISITADRLIRGQIEVSIRDQPGSWTTPVEVPGGSDKDVLVVVPTPSGFNIRDVRVRLDLGSGDGLAVEVELDPLDDEQIVGLLPDTAPPDLPPALTLPMDAGTARFVELDEQTLAAPGALDAVGTITAGPDSLGRLDGAWRRLLLDWVDQGGRLAVDAAPGTEVAGLPDAWQPGDSPRRAAGLGEINLVAGAIAAQRWTDVVQPTPTATMVDVQQMGGFNVSQIEATGDAVARDAGIDAIKLPWLLGFLAVYVLLAGPVAWFLLRNRRPVLGWFVIPALAVVFTGASFVVGTDLRAGTRAAHGSIVEVSPAGTRVTTIVGTVSRAGADGVSRFPRGWTAGAVDNSFFGNPAGAAELTVSTDGSRTEATIPLAAGGFGVVKGSGPAEAEGGDLVIEAHSEDGAIVGTIENTFPFSVERVGIFLGRDGDVIARIDAGETATFELSGNELQGGDPYAGPETRVWPRESGYNGNPDFNSIVSIGLWNEILLAAGPNGRPRGVVTAVGWTRAFTPDVEVVGQGNPEGRTAIVSRAAVAGGTDIAPGAARRELVRGPDGIELPDDESPLPVIGALWQFSLPTGAAGPLQVDIPFYMGRIDVWDGTAWVLVDDDLGDRVDPFAGDPTQIRHAALPEGIGADGQVWLRGWLLRDFSFDGSGLEVVSLEAAR